MLDKEEILNIIGTELTNSDYSTWNGTVTADLELSLEYYLGKPNGTEVDGRSQIVSTDVADAIEWIMPQIMKSFTQNNEVVIFDPVHEGDEKQAELESEYVYEVLMKQNDGFIVLHQFVKDALMQRNGIIKCYYAKHTHTKFADYSGITEEQLNMLLANDGVELRSNDESIDQNLTQQKHQGIQMQIQQMEQKAQQAMQSGQQIPPEMIEQFQSKMTELHQELEIPVMVYDVGVSASRIRGQIYVDPVPPEEFRLNSGHNSINLENKTKRQRFGGTCLITCTFRIISAT